ncbi:MAG TPA: diguanylate cyclase, partial [Solirubrobacterales bacterium]
MEGSSVQYASQEASAEEALSSLLGAVQELSLARCVEDVQKVVRVAARRLAAADGATFVLRDEDRCFYADEDAIAPLWKGERFPLSACISGWAMLNRQSVAIEDIYADPRIPHEAYRPTFVKSLVMVPIRRVDPLGAIGIYWAEQHCPTEREIALAQALADSTAVAMEHVRVLGELKETAALAETDSLTGLPNRRAWDEVLASAIGSGLRQLCVAVIDIDHFKECNDTEGHQAGDKLLQDAATAWRELLRGGDII